MSEVRNLRREKGLLHRTVANVDELRREVHHTQRELIKERTRCKALEEELENPMNVHRYVYTTFLRRCVVTKLC